MDATLILRAIHESFETKTLDCAKIDYADFTGFRGGSYALTGNAVAFVVVIELSRC